MFRKEELLEEIERKLDKWDERSSFVIKGVRNLSRADLDTLELYATYSGRLMKPRGEVGEVLAKYGYVRD